MSETSDVPAAPLNTVTWWEIPVNEIVAGRDFYSAVFGWTYTSFGDDANYAGILSGDVLVGGLYRAETGTPTAPSVRVYVNVADLEATLDAAVSAGGRVSVPRTEIGEGMGWWAEIADPDGRWVGLCSGNPPPAA
ncbi:VOC family protein [Georgenia halophila]|uniref:VOC family protein n=1 Tax=Georgenia halophila TaxID=620889 RepID=A0ABP8L6R2_9MICO